MDAVPQKRKLNAFARTATTFNTKGEFDEDAFHAYMQRFVDARIGVYVGSAGSGEGHSLADTELKRIYEIAVQVCKGKVPVVANPPEQHSARLTKYHALLAVEAGVDMVSIYGPDGRHGYRPMNDEFSEFFDDVLSVISHPVAIAPNPIIGYTPAPKLVAEICLRHPQIQTVNITGLGDEYFILLKKMIPKPLNYNVPLNGTPNTFQLGATGLIGGDFNILPKTCRRYVDLCEQENLSEAAAVYADLKRFVSFVQKWNSSNPRWIKMCMKVLKLPGGEGGLREPYRMPSADELKIFTGDLLQLRLHEIQEQAEKAGLVEPAN